MEYYFRKKDDLPSIPELPDGLPGSCRSRAVSSLDPVDRLQACDKIGTILNRLSESDKLSAFSD